MDCDPQGEDLEEQKGLGYQRNLCNSIRDVTSCLPKTTTVRRSCALVPETLNSPKGAESPLLSCLGDSNGRVRFFNQGC